MTHQYKHTRRLHLMLLAVLLTIIGLLSGAPLTSAQSGGSISYGTRLFGEITAEAPRVTFSFPGAAGDVIAVTADNWTGTLDLRADLIAPNGEVIGSSTQNTLDDNPMGASLSAVLPDDGSYLLRITSANATTGEFALSLAGRGPAASTPLLFGEAVDVTLVPAADPQRFSFEAEDCPTTLSITDLGPGRPYSYPFVVKVYDQRGQTVALLHGGEEVEDRVTVTARSGRYEVEVSSDDREVTGSVRLLVTCGAGASGCLAGAASMTDVVGAEPLACAPCFTPGDPLDNGGCPDLGFSVEQDGEEPFHVTVTWNAVAGATTYAVYVYGRTTGSGEVYLTHSVWTPGAPTTFTWFLPEHYVAFRFALRVYVGDDIICTAESGLAFEEPPPPPNRQRICLNFDLAVTANTGTTATLTWPAYPDAEAFTVTVFDAAHTVLPGWPVVIPATQLSIMLELPPGDYVVMVGPWTEADGQFCEQEVPLTLASNLPCEVRTDQLDVPMRIGPGVSHAIFAYMPAATDLRVIAQAQDGSGARWWQLDPTQIPGGGGVAGGLWVAQDQVEADPICGQLPTGDFVPPQQQSQQPQQPQPPDQPAGPGEWLPCGSCDACGHPAEECVTSPEGACLWDPTTCVTEPPPGVWLPCGSCDTCGHPAEECVTSPEGVCLWDPATCVTPPPPEPEQPEEEEAQCVFAAPAVNPSGASVVQLLTSGNCFSEIPGNYRPGTTVQARYLPANCAFTGWSGCAGGADNPITFTVTSSCTITANFTCP